MCLVESQKFRFGWKLTELKVREIVPFSTVEVGCR